MTCRCPELSMGLWAFAALGYSPRREVLSDACDAVAGRGLARLSPGQLSCLMWALASLRHPPPGPLLRAACCQITSRAPNFLPRDIAQAAWALQQFSELEAELSSECETGAASCAKLAAEGSTAASAEGTGETGTRPTRRRGPRPVTRAALPDTRSALRALAQRLKLWCGAGRGAGDAAPSPAQLGTALRAFRKARHWPGAGLVEAAAARVLARWNSFSRQQRSDIAIDLAILVQKRKADCPALRELCFRTHAEAAERAVEALMGGGRAAAADGAGEFLELEPAFPMRGSMDDGGSDYC